MYLELLQQIYGNALEKKAAAPNERKSHWAAAIEEMDSWWDPWKEQRWYPHEEPSPYLVKKVISPTGTVERYRGASKGPDYYKDMWPSNPMYEHDYDEIPKNSPRYTAFNNALIAVLTGKQPSEEDARIFDEHTAKVKKLKRRSVPRHSYIRE